jgi:hypothetical protein
MVAVHSANSVDVDIAPGNTITVPDTAQARPGGHVVFVVHNEDNQDHVVRIPTDEFAPENGGKPHPMEPLAIHWTSVAAHDVAVIKLKVRSPQHFDRGDWLYKYNVYSADDVFGKNEIKLDPQIEINN